MKNCPSSDGGGASLALFLVVMNENTSTSTHCPFLKEVVMLYCDACRVRKMVQLDHLVSTRPCLAERHELCPLFVDALRRASFAGLSGDSGNAGESGGPGKEDSS